MTMSRAGDVTANSVNLADLLSEFSDSNYYYYKGSKTTYDCEENVSWVVFDKVLPITAAQRDEANTSFSASRSFASGNGNNRAVQPLNDRKLYYMGAQ